MTITQAVAARTDEFLKERKMSRRQLAKASGLLEGTLENIYKQVCKSVTLTTLKAICDGLGITMIEFLNCKYFTDENLASGAFAETA